VEQGLYDFWKQLKVATIDGDGFLSLTTNFMNDPFFDSFLLVRSSYIALGEKIDEAVKGGTRGVIILGNPGIGKVKSIVGVANSFRVCFNCISFICLLKRMLQLFGIASSQVGAIFSLERQ